MAIRDLLWGCPLCGSERPLQEVVGRTALCGGCGARFRRADGARIVAERAGEPPVVRTAAEWSAELPQIPVPDGRSAPPQSAVVRVRFEVAQRPVRAGGVLVGWAEELGPERQGTLTLDQQAVTLRFDELDEVRWPLDRLSALQTSSSTLQLRPRGGPLASLRFTDQSVRRWDELLQRSLRRFYAETQGAEVLEFQPRIIVR